VNVLTIARIGRGPLSSIWGTYTERLHMRQLHGNVALGLYTRLTKKPSQQWRSCSNPLSAPEPSSVLLAAPLALCIRDQARDTRAVPHLDGQRLGRSEPRELPSFRFTLKMSLYLERKQVSSLDPREVL
jgi:hypothetical protein